MSNQPKMSLPDFDSFVVESYKYEPLEQFDIEMMSRGVAQQRFRELVDISKFLTILYKYNENSYSQEQELHSEGRKLKRELILLKNKLGV